MSPDQDGLKALLESLRSSNALAHLITPPTNLLAPSTSAGHENETPSPSQSTEIVQDPPPDSSASSRVKMLLAKLGPNPPLLQPDPPRQVHSLPSINSQDSVALETPPNEINLRNLTYHQSLSHMSRILEDEKCVTTLRELQKDQENLERQLWDARNQIIRRHEKKVKDRETQEKILTGSTELSPEDRRRLDVDLERALKKFDLENVLPAWDAILTRQQNVLEELRIPTIYATTNSSERLRQQKIVRVLEEGLRDGMMA
ncbi:hypothetical protein FRC03_005082 [Tulasnella sp. 419]|nr:hypothetical protein FRC03_005082 [Tulasnella sp. 419]